MPVLQRPGGRLVAFDVTGAPDGLPVFYQHGTGDSRLCRHPDEAVTAGTSVRLVTADRPGVGGSSRWTGPRARTILDWASDVVAIADLLELQTFVVAGHSGGAPHALAIAATYPDRVSAVGLAAPLTPFDEDGTKDLIKDADLKMIYRLTRARRLAAAVARAESRYYRSRIDAFLNRCTKNWPADRPIFTDPVLRPMFRAQFTAAFAGGGIGALDDMWAFLDWGFRPEDVRQPVHLFVGDADDVLDPQMSTRLAHRLPDCAVTRWPGAGHYGVYGRWRAFLEELPRRS
jgi:pimeloyl-ACP methyl ester carboxylesterase